MNNVTPKANLKYYPPLEEKINVVTHAFGIVIGIIGFALMLLKSIPKNDGLQLLSVTIYGVSIITLYTASTLFHNAKKPKARIRLNIFDHSAIYALIAGTYTPFTLVTLRGDIGWLIFGIIWLVAAVGIVLKFYYTGRFRILSTVMYVLMGWLVIFAIKPLYENLDYIGFILLIAGGIAYTFGAVLYAIKNIPYNHAIFHFFVLIGSILHFLSIYMYVL